MPFSELLRVGQAVVAGQDPVCAKLTGMLFSVIRQILRVAHVKQSKVRSIRMQVAFVLYEFIKELVHATTCK